MASDGGNQWDDEPRIELRGDPAYRQRGADYAEPYVEEEMVEARRSPSGFGPLRFALAGLALVVFAGLVFYAYSWGTGEPEPEELPVVAAPSGVEKEPPAEPGGMEVRYQDSMVLNPQNQQEDQIERLLPPPEEPQPRESLSETAEAVAEAPTAEESEQSAEEDAAPTDTSLSETSETMEETSVPPTPTPEVQDAASPPEPDIETETVPEEPAEAQDSEPEAAPAEEEPAPAQEAAPAAPASGGFMIQLASVSNRDAVQAEWSKLQQRHPQQLGNLELHIEEADLGDRGIFYRLQAGPVSSKESADSLCASLKAQQQDCLVRAR